MESPTTAAVKLVHHGAAATSSSKVLTWLQQDDSSSSACSSMVYASHAMINIARPVSVHLNQQQQQQQQQHQHDTAHQEQDETSTVVWNVQETLRTSHSYSRGPTEVAAVITTLTSLRRIGVIVSGRQQQDTNIPTLACGFSNGSLTVWNKTTTSNTCWQEQVVVDAMAHKTGGGEEAPRSITDMDGVVWHNRVLLAACSSAGVTCYSYHLSLNSKDDDDDATTTTTTTTTTSITHHTACAVQWESLSDSTLLLLIGTAAPRHNKIMVYTVTTTEDATAAPSFHLCGALTGHEDWITCFAWQHLPSCVNAAASGNFGNTPSFMMASGSQDFKIRLWKLTTTTTTTTDVLELNAGDTNSTDEDDDEEIDKEEDDYEDHESRMEIVWQSSSDDTSSTTRQMQTSVSLEALLLGHEGPVTATQWYNPTFGATTTSDKEEQPLVLLSSSMDRSILLWSPSEDDGIWTPISRVGSAGGILGGSIGSTLLGYVNVQTILPHNTSSSSSHGDDDHWLVGHAYGGALHMWRKEIPSRPTSGAAIQQQQNWKATPCVTGHFDGVTDLCWESTFGSYLLSVSVDQTCRMWAPVRTTNDTGEVVSSVWVEVARPQVHGYNLSAVTSLSSPNHRHWIVSGADEKELRILDAPMTTLRILQATQPSPKRTTTTTKEVDKENCDNPAADNIERVERAYIPSLGLSNKATAADGAEEDVQDTDDGNSQHKAVSLPSERDLGALSLWLETRKMFGHNTELFCVTSTLEAKTALGSEQGEESPILVASTAKAREVDDAAIRIWNPHSGECLQTLAGGHKSTVATLSFSPDGGKYLASSGKDRRLCVWKRQGRNAGEDQPLYSLAAAKDTAHKRIIWSVHFCPYDSTVLASGSRDGNIKIWKLTEAEDGVTVTMDQLFSFAPVTLNPAKKPDAVTALAFSPQPLPQNNNALLALGFECGLIELWSIPISKDASVKAPQLVHSFPPDLCHVATVTKLAWQPLRSNSNEILVLASGSADHGCRIFEVVPASLSI